MYILIGTQLGFAVDMISVCMCARDDHRSFEYFCCFVLFFIIRNIYLYMCVEEMKQFFISVLKLKKKKSLAATQIVFIFSC